MKDDTVGAAFGVVVVWPMAGSVLAGAWVLGWQALHWLNTATWPGITLRDALSWWNSGAPVSDWTTGAHGLDKILAWCLDGSSVVLWLMLIFPAVWLAVGVFIFSALFSERR